MSRTGTSGYPALIREALTYDDILLVPHYSDLSPKEVDLRTLLTKKIQLNIPLISAAMDTVTESKLAIAIAHEGGIGIIHRNHSIESQVKEVRIVKRAANGVIYNPAVLLPRTKIKDAINRMVQSSVSSFPIVEDKKVVGILTNRDLRSEFNPEASISSIMTKKVITASERVSLDEAKRIMRKNKIEKLVITNKEENLKGLICMKDIQDTEKFPNASKDKAGRLRVGAAISTSAKEFERVKALIKADVDCLVLDTAHGHHKSVGDMVRKIKGYNKNIQVIGGNIATAEGCKALIEAGVDGVKVGIGPGSICTTRIVAGVGIPQVTAIMEAVKVARAKKIPVIADGGIKYSGDIAKALGLGASSVMVGSLFAGADEAPGETIFTNGRRYKLYRGMGSLGAMAAGSKERYHQSDVENHKLVPEGIEGGVPVRGPLVNIVNQLLGGVRNSLGYCGAKDLQTFSKTAQFVRMTSNGLKESHVHDVVITKEAPNYKIAE